jgi:hypothetical protein
LKKRAIAAQHLWHEISKTGNEGRRLPAVKFGSDAYVCFWPIVACRLNALAIGEATIAKTFRHLPTSNTPLLDLPKNRAAIELGATDEVAVERWVSAHYLHE